MKKIAWFFVIVLLASVLIVVQKRPLYQWRFAENATFVVTARDRPLSTSFWSIVQNGDYVMVTTTSSFVGWLMANVEEPVGQSWHIETSTPQQTGTEVISSLQGIVFSVEILQDVQVYNGYSLLLPAGVYNNGHRQNFQLVVGQNCVIVGSPLILESY